MIRLALLLMLLLTPARGEEIVAGLSQNQVSITAFFEGSEIFVFGAVKRDAPPPADAGPLQVLVSIVGPVDPVTVRRKARVAGVWVNRDTVVVDRAPYFYANASTVALREMLSHTDQMRHRIGLEWQVVLRDAPADIEDTPAFREAVIRQRTQEGLYRELPGAVRLTDETLFDVSVRLPANLVEGDYLARVFLTRDKAVISTFETQIAVRKSGIEDWTFRLAQERPLIYGLLSVALALSLGWLAASLFRYLRN
ncbi:TIGR02186 family protein [Pontivivens ytuae]|uniref:TIGR02186 family protein n=1 Tax=Pontivivens ytuae TaxID=2789856 RepID=A0A7S9LUD7_9RHOB|nr:TIGR02186 family protein [Pontivivens ytuae]QPH54930.1 TIGR02186 family protein [Pontivivens ytuae]